MIAGMRPYCSVHDSTSTAAGVGWYDDSTTMTAPEIECTCNLYYYATSVESEKATVIKKVWVIDYTFFVCTVGKLSSLMWIDKRVGRRGRAKGIGTRNFHKQ